VIDAKSLPQSWFILAFSFFSPPPYKCWYRSLVILLGSQNYIYHYYTIISLLSYYCSLFALMHAWFAHTAISDLFPFCCILMEKEQPEGLFAFGEIYKILKGPIAKKFMLLWVRYPFSKAVSSNVLYIYSLYPYFTVFFKRFHPLYILSLQQHTLNHVLYTQIPILDIFYFLHMYLSYSQMYCTYFSFAKPVI
jgi:hypothetical protein